MRFLLDNCLADRLAIALNVLSSPDGHEVTHLAEKFGRDVKDVDWIRKLGEEGDWVIVSGDYKITKRPHERSVWSNSGLTAFFLEKGWTNYKFWDQSWRLLRVWPHIVEQARMIQPGAGFLVPVTFSGKRGAFKQLS